MLPVASAGRQPDITQCSYLSLSIQYLHCVSFSTACLSVCEYCPIVTPKYICKHTNKLTFIYYQVDYCKPQPMERLKCISCLVNIIALMCAKYKHIINLIPFTIDLATPSYISSWVVFGPKALSKLYVLPYGDTVTHYHLIVCSYFLPLGIFECPWAH